MGPEATGESCGTKGRLGEELTSSQFGGFHAEECNRKQKGSGGMGQGPADGRDQVMVPAEARKVFQEL
jgi:hypothetical protein